MMLRSCRRWLRILSQLSVLVASSMLICVAHGQVHKWTDKDGKVVYGDMPPPGTESSSLKIAITSFGGPPVFKSYSSSAVKRESGAPRELVLYSADWCPHCRNAKAFFGANKIAYREVNIESDASGAAEFKRVFGGGGIPLAAAGDKTIRGFSAESMLYFLKANGLVDKTTRLEK